MYKFRRGYAFKVTRDVAEKKFGLKLEESIGWVSPDGSQTLTDQKANLNNARRRSTLNVSDAWADLKAVDQQKAKELGWNGFQRLVRGVRGSKIGILKRIQKIGVDIQSIEQLAVASEGEPGDNNGWGDSG